MYRQNQTARTFAKRLRAKRKEKRITLQRLAEKAGMSPATINKYENCRAVPSILMAFELAGCLGVTPAWLLGLSDDEKQSEAERQKEIRIGMIMQSNHE